MFLSNKTDVKTDGVGDLYRCAEKLAKGNIDVGMDFYQMAKNKLGKMVSIGLTKKNVEENSKFWAEMVLDEYMRLKWMV